MNEQNYEYLKDSIKYLGFGEKLNDSLKEQLSGGKESFRLHFNTEVNKKPFEARLQFRRSDATDLYFLNGYEAALTRSNGQKMEQQFYLTKGKGMTAKEAYNLLEGRSVFKELTNKDGQPYKAWVQLDFDKKDKHNNHELKQFHENYGYDLKASLSKLAISELDGGEKEKALMHSLRKGNLQSVSIEKEGMVSKMFVEASPQFKSVNLYDANLKRVPKENLEMYRSKEQAQAMEVKQEKKQELKPGGEKAIQTNRRQNTAARKTRTTQKKVSV
jgi:hypothetical protein